MTQDLDVVVAADPANFEALGNALSEIDARILGPGGERSSSPPGARLLASSDHWQLSSDHGLLDVVTAPAHLGSFDEVRGRAHEVTIEDFTVPIASRADLLTLKRAAGRPQDIADIDLLESIGEDEDGDDHGR